MKSYGDSYDIYEKKKWRLASYHGYKKKNIKTEKNIFYRWFKKYICLINTANSEWNKHLYQKLLHFLMFYTIGKLFFL